MTDLEFIKKHYGEKFAHFCRENFSTILEKPGLLSKTIFDHFAPTHSLYNDLILRREVYNGLCWDVVFVEFIYQLVNSSLKSRIVKTNKTPYELLDEAGYILFPECKTEDDIQAFKKYYANGEELCTFNGGRTLSHRVWFAIKKNVDQINRENFTNPKRQDEYGTSVISIQINKKSGMLSIKNRYNHAVKTFNPDATFSNNLDNIIFGLTYSFKTHFHIEEIISGENFDYFYPYVLGSDNKLYRYNMESNNNYYCENNYIIYSKNNKPIKLNSSRYLLMDMYILDMQKKKFFMLKGEEHDSFIDSVGEIDKINILTYKEKSKAVIITPKKGKKVYIGLNKHSEITKYINENAIYIGDNFMPFNSKIDCISLPNVRIIGDEFLGGNENLTLLYLPNARKVGCHFLSCNATLKKLIIPNVSIMGHSPLDLNESLEYVYAPNLLHIDKLTHMENESIIIDKLINKDLKNRQPICL